MSILLKRQSTRTYTDKPIEDETIKALLKSAMQAPSAKNQQPWEFFVITNKAILKELATVSNGARHLENAQAAILTLMQDNTSAMHMRPQDLSAATMNILLEATNLDLGSLWIGIYPLEERITNIKNILTIPEHLTPFSLIALGYPTNPLKPKSLRYDPSRVTTIK